MALKLGELLVREKLITVEQLDEALRNQIAYSVRLGSALIEMGYVEEDVLARILSEKLGVPLVSRADLSDIPKGVIDDFSRALVAKYHVMPFKLERNRLGLAMTDPNDFNAIEEIAFITGHVVQPFIAPDVRISHAQARYYRINDGEARYQYLAKLWSKRNSVNRRVSGTATPSGLSVVEPLNGTISPDFENFASLNEVLTEKTSQPQENGNSCDPERISAKFAEARSREDVADALSGYLGRVFGTGALFILRGNEAVGWRGVSNGKSISGIHSLSLALSKPSVLKNVSETKEFYLGSLALSPENRRILEILGLADDAPLFVVPVIMLGKAVVAVVISADMDNLGPYLKDLQNLIKKMSLAFEMLIMKNKLLTA